MSAELIGRRSFLARTGTGLVLAGTASSLLSTRPAWAWRRRRWASRHAVASHAA